MRKEKALRQTFSALAIVVLISAFVCLPPETSVADSGKDFVIVIDVSTSMQDIFEEVKQFTNRTLREAKIGDNVAVITFGERATLVDRKQIRGKADIESLEKQVEELYPTDYSTYINRGLEKGLAELQYLFEKYPDRERVLLWLSDDKDNPPEALGEDYLTLDKLRKESEEFEPTREWFAYNAPLSEVKNVAVEDFVTWARRTTFRVAVKESDVELGSFKSGNVKKKVVLTFEPQHPGAVGLEFAAEAQLIDPKDPTRKLPVSLYPQRLVASGSSWKQEFQIAFEGKPGEYKGELSFESLSGPVLDVEPQTVAFTAMIAPPKLAPEELATGVKDVGSGGGLLADAKRQGLIATEKRPAGLTRAAKPLAFGPLQPGKKDSKIITLFLDKEADPKSVAQDLSIQLPKGVNVDSKVFGSGLKLAAEITVSVDQDAPLSNDILQGAFEGRMRFKSSESGVKVLPLYIPLRVTLSSPNKLRWGRKLLPAAASLKQRDARQMTFDEMTKEIESEGKKAAGASPLASALENSYSKMTSRYVLFPVVGALAVLLIVLLYRIKPTSELLVGELVVIKDPGDSKLKNVNLKRIGSLHGKDTLTLGSSPKADVRLKHGSVELMHCRISARMIEDQTEIIIHPIKGCPLRVNDVERSEKTRLSDKDLLGIGDYILLFSNPEPQKEVVVHFLDGRTMRGTPVTWDIGAPVFELLRTDVEGSEETAEEIVVVNFADLKAVFFMQDASGRQGIPRERIRTGELIEVTFSDGESIEGHPLNDYSDFAGRFYLVPREMPNVISVLVERNSVKETERREVRGEPEGARQGFLRGRKGAAPAK